MAMFVVATALAVYHLVLIEQHMHHGLVGLLTACGLAADAPVDQGPPNLGDVLVLAAPAAVLLLPLAWLARCVWLARRARRRQLDLLALVGEPAPAYGATIVDYGLPAVYCLPGRNSRVVVTRGALDILNEAQLQAVLEHERAHIKGRHHLPRPLADAFARAFPGLPRPGISRNRRSCYWR